MASSTITKNWSFVAAIALSAVAIAVSLSSRTGNVALASRSKASDLSSLQVSIGFGGILVFDSETGNIFGYSTEGLRNKQAIAADFLGRITEPGRPLDRSPTAVIDMMIAMKDAQGLNSLAWNIVVSDPDPSKDYRTAMRAATNANAIADGKSPAILDTLARCYFVTGDVQTALGYQKKAVALLTKETQHLRSGLEATLREYENASR